VTSSRPLDALLATLAAALVVVVGASTAGVTPHVELSDSMRPALHAGDVLWLKSIPAREARVGDVVAFDDPTRRATLLHRVQRIAPERRRLSFTTRGDANKGGEDWSIAREGEIGRYTGARIPVVGRAVVALADAPLGMLGALSLAVLAFLGLRRIWAG
jgi:signal peptidase